MNLRPDAVVLPADLTRGKNALVRDSAWASVTGAMQGGVILVGFALSLEAGPLVLGLLASIPLVAQLAQLPGVALIERIRHRRRIGVIALMLARTVVLLLAALPFLPDQSWA